MNKRRLLKDMPFDNLSKGTVVSTGLGGLYGKYHIEQGNTYYKSGSSSSRGVTTFDKKVEEIIDLVWDNEEWFEDADLEEIKVIPSNTKIILEFKPIDIEEAENLAKGIMHILPHLGDDSYVWGKFKDVKTIISNH